MNQALQSKRIIITGGTSGIGRLDDVASLIVYLLSGANHFISGQTILVDGGISALMESPD